MCLGMVLDFEYQVVRVYEVYANHKEEIPYSKSTQQIQWSFQKKN